MIFENSILDEKESKRMLNIFFTDLFKIKGTCKNIKCGGRAFHQVR